MKQTHPQVDEFIRKAEQWQAEFEALRAIALDCLLAEELKWGVPCYTHDQKNIVLIHGFKEYCALLFFKGVLLKDPAGILITQTENVQAARQIRFTHLQEIQEKEPLLKGYIAEAIEVEKAGLQVDLKKTAEYKMPEELQTAFDETPALKTAFEGLTPGRQRAYLLYFSSAKQAKTRISRIEKYTEKILSGKGMQD
jgi:uncharacterized protein YdeI (YjbR/CyaY-like superfamily)